MEVPPPWYTRMFSPEWHKAGKIMKRKIDEDDGLWGLKEEREKIQQKMCRDALNKIDFQALRPYLTQESYESLCQHMRTTILETYKLVPQKSADPALKLYYEKFHKHNPLQELVLKYQALAVQNKALLSYSIGIFTSFYVLGFIYKTATKSGRDGNVLSRD